MKVNIDGDFIFDGYETLNVTIHNANEEQKVRNRSYENKIAECKNLKTGKIWKLNSMFPRYIVAIFARKKPPIYWTP